MPSKRKHLLIMRLSAMGDVAMLVPVLKAFRSANPDAEVTILTRAFFQAFFRDVEGVRFFSPDLSGRHKGFPGLIRLAKDLAALGITHVADVHDVLRTKIVRTILSCKGVKVAVIDKGRAEKRALTRKHRKLRRQLKTTVERYRETLIRAGMECPEPVPATRQAAPIPEEIRRITGPKSGRWIGVAPFAQHRGKIYPLPLMAELIGKLSEKGTVFIFGGGDYEREYAEAMEQKYPGVVSVIGKIRLASELDLISNLDVKVTMDSAAMHMASLVGVPVVSVWGATHPFAGFYGFGQDMGNAVQLDLDCRPCSVYGNKKCMWGDWRCLERIHPEVIAARVGEVLDNL